jgi:hypothetical protein
VAGISSASYRGIRAFTITEGALRLSVLALLALSMAGCNITDLKNTTVRVQGTVTAAATGQPIVGAQMKLYPSFIQEAVATGTTDAQGRYSLSGSVSNCIDGDFGLFVGANATGFDSKGMNAFCNTDLQQINFSLSPPTTP